jgi:hypothetical protein
VTVAVAAGTLAVAGSARASVDRYRIGVPAYWAPDSAGLALFTELADAAPGVDAVIVNGPDSAAPNPYSWPTASAIRRLHDAGVKALGYVASGYLGRTGRTTSRTGVVSSDRLSWQQQVLGDVEDWYRLYGWAGLDGVFLDETLAGCGTDDEDVDAYRELTDQIRQAHRNAYLVMNPGTDVDECYLPLADSFVTFENTFAVYQEWTPPTWVYDYPASKFWHIVYDTPTDADMREAVALFKHRNATRLYVTDDAANQQTPLWYSLPTRDYWRDELRQISCTRW